MCVCVERYASLFLSPVGERNYFSQHPEAGHSKLHSTPPVPSPPHQTHGVQQLDKKAVRKTTSEKRDKWWEGSQLLASWTELHVLTECWSYNRRQFPFFLTVCLLSA